MVIRTRTISIMRMSIGQGSIRKAEQSVRNRERNASIPQVSWDWKHLAYIPKGTDQWCILFPRVGVGISVNNGAMMRSKHWGQPSGIQVPINSIRS